MYGAEGLAYPVREGQTWQVGNHKFTCGDLGAYEAPFHHVLYCDPPWNDAMLRGFHTKADLPHPGYHWDDLYRAIVATAHPDAGVWLEGGVRQAPEIEALLPGPVKKAWAITYYGNRPCVLAYSGNGEPPDGLASSLNGTDDDDVPGLVLAAYGRQRPQTRLIVLDPCAGRGVTSRAAEAVRWASANNELNPLRVSASLARMVKLTGQEAVRIA
jgi:hypothetical protein